MKNILPIEMLTASNQEELLHILGWWNSLSENEKSEVCAMYHPRCDNITFIHRHNPDGNSTWEKLPINKQINESKNENAEELDWLLDYFHHLLDHDEINPPIDINFRTYHMGSWIIISK